MKIEILEGHLYCDSQKFDLEDYKILHQLGSGANAVVFKVLVLVSKWGGKVIEPLNQLP